MTLNGLVIQDRIVQRFMTDCRQHYETGGCRPVERARITFFAALRQDYPVNTFVKELPHIFQQLDTWEQEAQASELPEAA